MALICSQPMRSHTARNGSAQSPTSSCGGSGSVTAKRRGAEIPSTATKNLLVPRYMATSLMWAPNVADFAKGYRAYAVDIMGQPSRSIPWEPIRSGAGIVNVSATHPPYNMPPRGAPTELQGPRAGAREQFSCIVGQQPISEEPTRLVRGNPHGANVLA